MCVLALLALEKALQQKQLSRIEKQEIESQLHSIPCYVHKLIEQVELTKIVDSLKQREDVFFIGRILIMLNP